MINFNPNSNQHVSTLLFGGTLKYKIKEQVGFYKTNGKPKFKNVEKEFKLPRLVDKSIRTVTSTGRASVGESTLQQIKHKHQDDIKELANILLEIRFLEKQISTYFNAVEELVYDFDNCIHGQLSHCGYETGLDKFGGGTSTGRLSSRAPNLQNFPRDSTSTCKKYFTSRFKDGKIIEVDYKQLELCIFAFLTQDVSLINDIVNGVDIHAVSAAKVNSIDISEVTKDQRQAAKGVNFGIIYGAGARKVAKAAGITEEEAKAYIDSFYDRYPMTKPWQDSLVDQVKLTARYIPKLTPKGQSVQAGYFKSIIGREYWFETVDAPDFLIDKGILTSFNPPSIKNYPVQGLATADIVLLMVGRLWRNLLNNRDKCLLINTVHDSIILDCKKEFIDFTCNLVKNELELVKEMMKELFNVQFNVPITVDIKVADSWGG